MFSRSARGFWLGQPFPRNVVYKACTTTARQLSTPLDNQRAWPARPGAAQFCRAEPMPDNALPVLARPSLPNTAIQHGAGPNTARQQTAAQCRPGPAKPRQTGLNCALRRLPCLTSHAAPSPQKDRTSLPNLAAPKANSLCSSRTSLPCLAIHDRNGQDSDLLGRAPPCLP